MMVQPYRSSFLTYTKNTVEIQTATNQRGPFKDQTHRSMWKEQKDIYFKEKNTVNFSCN